MTERSKTPRWALDAIERARAEESKVLSLIGYGRDDTLACIPEEVFSCTKLERLHLDGNALTVVPHLGRLEHLRAVHLVGNPLREVADQPGLVLDWFNYLELRSSLTFSHVVGIRCRGDGLAEALIELPHLEWLDLSSNQLSALPESVGRLTSLRLLNVSSNQLSALPGSVVGLTNLELLSLAKNRFSALPESVGRLTNLRWLDLSDNQCLALPESVGRLTNLRWLDLSDNQFSALPESVGRLTNLESLSLTKNQFSALPESIGRLANLGWLSLRGNYFSALPESVAELTNLESLGLASNQFSELPESVGRLMRLRWLDLSNNRFSVLPEGVAGLTDLESLSLASNQFSELPESVGRLTRLRALDLSNNQFSALPESVGRLTNLRLLNLSNNRFSALPASVERLTRLGSLDLSSNQLSALPSSMTSLEQLTILHISGLPIKVLPAWVVDLPRLEWLYAHCQLVENVPQESLSPERWEPANLEGLRAFFREAALEGLEVVCEAKLLIVGEGEAGKTSLLRRLLDPQAELPGADEGTQGIDVQDWIIQEVVRAREDSAQGARRSQAPNTESPRELTVHVWDFAGQEIAYPTHQFFLTKRSVYALVVSSRHTHMLDYWLNIIQLLSDASPVVLIDNQKGDQTSAADLGKIKAAFSNVKAACATNLLTRRGLAETELALRAELRALPLIGQVMPKSWKRVRDALGAEQANYITLKRYRELCDAHDFSGEQRQGELLSFLHDLGVCLHFDTTGLSHWVILRPEWATDAVYRVVRDAQITAANGRFVRSDLRRIWPEAAYQDVRDVLLELMTHFKLCYRLPVEEAYVIPLLLPDSAPSVDWDNSAELRLRYDYEFMPHGIATALTVSVYPLIEQQDRVWRHGGVFASDGARAWVYEEPNRGRLNVHVAGPYQKQLLGVLHHELTRIHARFHGLRVKRWIPCPCAECQDAPEPFRFDEDMAHKAFNAGRELQCQHSYEMLAPQHLLRLVGEELGSAEDSRPSIAGLQPTSFRDRLAPALEELAPAPRQVFISYKWGGASEQLAEAVENGLRALGLAVVRDRSAMGYKDDIGAFMKLLGDGHCVVAILSDAYLKSDNCMSELVGVGEKADFWQRIFPITLADAAIYKPVRRIEYTKHWQQQFEELNEALDGTDKTSHNEAFRELERYKGIAANVDRITKRLSEMNTLSPEEHQATRFEQLGRALRQRLDEVSRRRPVGR